jgi:methionyl-tRNA formyltransferase
VTLPLWLTDSIIPEAQDESQVTTCKMFTRDDGRVDFTKSAKAIYNQYRGLTPWPGIWTTWNEKRLKLLVIASEVKQSPDNKTTPGKVQMTDEGLFIECGSGLIQILKLQLEGKKAMSVQEFLNGFKTIVSTTLPN